MSVDRHVATVSAWGRRALAAHAWLLPAAAVGSAVVAGSLLALAFPPFEWAPLGWLAFVPLLVTIRYVKPGQAFRLGWIAGLAFWLPTTVWLLRLTPHAVPWLVALGWGALAAYAAVYTAAFAWVFNALSRVTRIGKIGRNLILLTAGPLIWAGLEYVRCRVLSGFPWNPLGVSQYRNLPLIQIAEWTGVHGVSALVMVFNVSLSLTVIRYLDPAERRRGFHLELALAALLLAVCWRMGLDRERRFRPVAPDLHVAVVQPGVLQDIKWEDGMAERIYDRLSEAIDDAAMLATILGGRPPDLIVLPETVLPYYVHHTESLRFIARHMSPSASPLLLGVMAAEEHPERILYFNRSILLVPGQNRFPAYDKQHLVPFGEVIPFSRQIPWLERFAPLGWNCTPGREPTVFNLPDRDAPFAVTICFEDAFPYVSRRFARAGARWLINQTNDAWFDPSSASRQHLAQGVFRSVETRLPTLRAANTGISALIDANGRIRERLPVTDPQQPQSDVAFWRVEISPPGVSTVFTRYGAWTFSLPATAVAALALAWTAIMARRGQRSGEESPIAQP